MMFDIFDPERMPKLKSGGYADVLRTDLGEAKPHEPEPGEKKRSLRNKYRTEHTGKISKSGLKSSVDNKVPKEFEGEGKAIPVWL